MKNSNVLNVGKLHNPDIRIGSCEILINQVEKIKKILFKLDDFVPHPEIFDDYTSFIFDSLMIIEIIARLNLEAQNNE